VVVVNRFLALVVTLAALAVPTQASASTTWPVLNAAASTYVGHPVTIECASSPDDFIAMQAAEGTDPEGVAFAEPWNDRAFMQGYDCTELVKWSRGTGDPSDEGQFVQIFTHEATHLTGLMDEGVTECTAVRNVWRMLRILNPHASSKRMKAAYQTARELHSSQTGEYRTVC
jgi:hypothetical protein